METMLFKLFIKPQATISSLISKGSKFLSFPFVGFFLIAFAEGYERTVTRFSDLSSISLVGITFLLALLVGVWVWAGFLGGIIYLSSRLFRGKPGFLDTVNAIGLAFVWPGMLAFLASILVIFGGYRGEDDLSALSAIGFLLQIIAGLWGLYNTILAIKSHHEFGWAKAISAYTLPFVVIILAVSAFMLIVLPK